MGPQVGWGLGGSRAQEEQAGEMGVRIERGLQSPVLGSGSVLGSNLYGSGRALRELPEALAHQGSQLTVPFGGASVGFSSNEFLLISNKSH